MLGHPRSPDSIYWLEGQLEGWRQKHDDHQRRYVRTLRDLSWHSLLLLAVAALSWLLRQWILNQVGGVMRNPFVTLPGLVLYVLLLGAMLRREAELISAARRRRKRSLESLDAYREHERRLRVAKKQQEIQSGKAAGSASTAEPPMVAVDDPPGFLLPPMFASPSGHSDRT